ncbi:MAG: glycosyltransferase family 1 protein [Thermoleophilia bacterium]|nr:glycosyltransferase family 1 protein [Thermoleophilia bacterium]
MLVAPDDAANVDWSTTPEQHRTPVTVSEGPLDIAWIMSPPGLGSGGHQNLFRFIRFAEQAGHRCTIYLYTNADLPISVADLKAMVRSTDAYANVEAEMVVYDRSVGVHSSAQALFATGWETAYPVFSDPTHARRFYFVQDFEPSFYALGTESLLAENTYRFGFRAITAGGWLAHKLRGDYGMTADSFDFASDSSHYFMTNFDRRREVFFYARPVTPRRAFDFGVLVLKDFARLLPDARINLAGWDVSGWDLPFPHIDHASLDLKDLNQLYNRCASGLVLSLSNMSLLPLELMSSGVVPVVNDAPNNRMVSDNPYIDYSPTAPMEMARHLAHAVTRADQVENAVAMSKSVSSTTWEQSGSQFLDALQRGMRG